MDSVSLNEYEEQLYSVFKTFDVDNSETLDRPAVVALCDALQLEQRGAALVDTLFESREQRVTFAQFRGGLLAVLGADAEATTVEPAAPATHSDDDSSGREVAPKFVFGSKKYGRRSRPAHCSPAPDSEPPATPELEHERRVDCGRALALCRHLRMEGIDHRLVERIFEEGPSSADVDMTVGEFFDRLDSSLTTSLAAGVVAGGDAPGGGGGALPAEVVVDALERGGVTRPRRLLAELGFTGAAVRHDDFERALDAELAAFTEPLDTRAVLLRAALAVSRERARRAERSAAAAAAERDRLRADVADTQRRAQLLAQEVDDNHARLERELSARLRRAEARHADEMRAVRDELASERERAGTERVRLEAEVARRREGEMRLRDELGALREHGDALETRAAAAETKLESSERERARLVTELQAVRDTPPPAQRDAEEASARLEELRQDNARLRDRCDELCAALEVGSSRSGTEAPGVAERPASWREEEARTAKAEESAEDARSAGDATQHQAALVRELESSLEALRAEYDACEEYWAGKLQAERDAARAGDERLAELMARVEEYERRFARRAPAPSLPPVAEARALEAQVTQLQDEAAAARAHAAQLAAARGRCCAQWRARAAALAGLAARAAEGTTLRLRLQRAEGAVSRLTARLAAADLLVKDLYVENCLLAPRAPLPL